MTLYGTKFKCTWESNTASAKKLKPYRRSISRKCGCSTNHIRHIECKLKKPSLELLVEMCNAMNVSPQFLLQDSITSKEVDELDIIFKNVKSLNNNYIKTIIDVINVLINNLQGKGC